MSAFILSPAINRLLPYRGLHTDLVAHEDYYSFNDPSTAADEDVLTSWTVGAAASVDEVLEEPWHWFNGKPTTRMDGDPGPGETTVYVQSAVTNLDTALPSTFRIFVACRPPGVEVYYQEVWLRVFDPNDAGTDAWFHVEAEITLEGEVVRSTATVGNTGVDVTEARVVNPIPGLTNEGTGVAGDANHYVICELELPAAASRTLRIQLVDGNGATVLASSTDPVYIARADVRQGKVSKWTCRRTGRTFSQSDPAKQPYARPMGVPQFNGRRVLFFGNAQYLVSDDAPATWAFLNSGAECSVYVAALNTADGGGNVLSNMQFSPTTDGWNFQVDASLDEWSIEGRNAAAEQIFNIRTPRALDTLYVLGYRALDGHVDGDAVADLGGSELTANSAIWGAGAPPTHTLHIGARPPGSVFFDGYIGDIAIYDVRLEDDEHARAIEELESWNTGSCSIPGCVIAVAADHGVIGDPVARWENRLGGLPRMSVSLFDGGSPIDPPEGSPAFRGSQRMKLDNLQGFLSSSALFSDLNVDHAIIVSAQALSDEGVLWESRNLGTNTYERLAYASGQWAYTRRAQGGSTDSVNTGAVDTRPHVHSFVLASGQRSAWRDGVSLFSGVASNPGTMTGVDWTSLGGGGDVGSGMALGIAEFAAYNVAPNAYQRQLVERAQRRRLLGLDQLTDGLMKVGTGTFKGHTLGLLTAAEVFYEQAFDTFLAGATLTEHAVGQSLTLRSVGAGGGGARATGDVGQNASGGGGEERELVIEAAGVSYTFAPGTAGAPGVDAGATDGGDSTWSDGSGVILRSKGGKKGVASPGGTATAGAGGTGGTGGSGRDGGAGGVGAATGNGAGGGSGGSDSAGSGNTPGDPDGTAGNNSGTDADHGAGGARRASSAARAGGGGRGEGWYSRVVDPARAPFIPVGGVSEPWRESAANTTRALDTPGDHETNDRFLVLSGVDGFGALTTLSGGTLLVDAADSNNNAALAAYGLTATGSDVLNLGSANVRTCGYVFRIRNAAPPASWGQNGAQVNNGQIVVPGHTLPGGPRPILWVFAAAFDSSNNNTSRFSAFPADSDRRLILWPRGYGAGFPSLVVAFKVTTGTDTQASVSWTTAANRHGYAAVIGIPLLGS